MKLITCYMDGERFPDTNKPLYINVDHIVDISNAGNNNYGVTWTRVGLSYGKTVLWEGKVESLKAILEGSR